MGRLSPSSHAAITRSNNGGKHDDGNPSCPYISSPLEELSSRHQRFSLSILVNMLSPEYMFYAVVVAISSYVFFRPIIIHLLDPLGLHKYPSPSPFAAITPFWLMREAWYQRRSATVHKDTKG